MKRMFIVAFATFAFVFLLSAKNSNADVAPPPRPNPCNVLPNGSTCYVNGRRGTCAENIDPIDRERTTCRLGVLPVLDAGASSQPPPAPAPAPAPASSCRAAPASRRSLGGLAAALLTILLFFRRQRHDARGWK